MPSLLPLAILSLSPSLAAAQPCQPELIPIGGPAFCGSYGRVDSLIVYERNGTPRLFALARYHPMAPNQPEPPSAILMWNGETWERFSFEDFHRHTTLVSVPGNEYFPGRLYAAGYPSPEALSTEPPKLNWLPDDWYEWRSAWIDLGRTQYHNTPLAIIPWLSEEPYATVLIGGDFRENPTDTQRLIRGCFTGCGDFDGPPGGLPTSNVRALAYFALPSTSQLLYAGGVDLDPAGSTLLRQNGAAWEPIPINETVTALKVHADSLWITTPQRLIRLDASGLHPLPPLPGIQAIEWFDDGHGERLYAGGSFTTSTTPANHVAAFDGANWQPVGPGFSDSELTPAVTSLATFDLGQGPRLIAGGHFSRIGSKLLNNIAAWDGTSWKALGNTEEVRSPTYHTADAQREVYMLAWSRHDIWYQPLDRVLRLHNNELEILGDDFPPGSSLQRLLSIDLGSGPDLYAIGAFSAAPGNVPASGIARWDGQSWHALGPQVPGQQAQIRSAAAWDEDGPGPLPRSLYVTGNFTAMGTTPVLNVARWDGTTWHPLDQGLTIPGADLIVREGRGINELLVFTDSNNTTDPMARWNGAWTMFPGSLVGSAAAGNSLAVMDSGTGPDVYTCGSGWGVSRWNGAAWSTVTNLPSGYIETIAAFDDGDGPALYLGGFRDHNPGVYRWTSQSFRQVHAAQVGVRELTTTSDGTHPGLLISESVLNPGITFYRGCQSCGTADFNNDGDSGTDADIEAFFACLAGNCCPLCFGPDFNNDGDSGTDADIESFFRVLAGAPC